MPSKVAIWPLTSHLTNYPRKVRRTCRGSEDKLVNDVLLHAYIQILANQQKITFIISVRTLDAVYLTYQEQCQIGTYGKRKTRESVMSAHLWWWCKEFNVWRVYVFLPVIRLICTYKKSLYNFLFYVPNLNSLNNQYIFATEFSDFIWFLVLAPMY